MFSCQSDASTEKQEENEESSQLTPEPEPEERVLVWSDEFEGTSLDLNDWNFEIGDGCPNLCGWGNNELQSYTDSNHRLEDGMLVISAKKETDYTSTRILTKGKQEFTYGRIETRVKVPTGAGLWPAFWALGADIDTVSWPDCGEIDIMEQNGSNKGQLLGTFHCANQGSGEYASYGLTKTIENLNISNVTDNFHLYSMIWTPNLIKLLVDDTLLVQLGIGTNAPFDNPH